MPRRQLCVCFTVALALLCPSLLPAKDPGKPGTGARPAREREARQIVARFEKGDPGGKVRMDALVRLARVGPAAVPVLAEALHKGSPWARELAAQALVLFAEPSTRAGLERALA